MSVRTLSSRIVYENRWLTVREDQIERSDGSRGLYAVVDKREAALVVPWDGERLHLVGQFRYTIGGFAWEFPQGTIDAGEPDPGGPEGVARTELEEETGLRAGRLQHVGHLWFAYGMTSQGCDVWLATELEAGTPQPNVEEHDLHQRAVTPAEFRALLADGEIEDAATLAAWTLLDVRGVRP